MSVSVPCFSGIENIPRPQIGQSNNTIYIVCTEQWIGTSIFGKTFAAQKDRCDKLADKQADKISNLKDN